MLLCRQGCHPTFEKEIDAPVVAPSGPLPNGTFGCNAEPHPGRVGAKWGLLPVTHEYTILASFDGKLWCFYVILTTYS